MFDIGTSCIELTEKLGLSPRLTEEVVYVLEVRESGGHVLHIIAILLNDFQTGILPSLIIVKEGKDVAVAVK